ncbi:MAG TPA: DUF3619 family protein [Burkholderiales bacterium]|jgi:hypothetical protein
MSTEKQIAKKITAYLDHGTAQLRAGTAYRLQQARARALAQVDPAYAEAPALEAVLAGSPGARRGRIWASTPVRLLGVALIVAAAAFGWQQWRAFQQVQDLQDLDMQILTSDIPIDAYLDRGFLNWLKADSDR